jgi:hypothetical protein
VPSTRPRAAPHRTLRQHNVMIFDLVPAAKYA